MLRSDAPFAVDGAAARLDALVALGEVERLEEEAAPFIEEASYTRPFALRALGINRADTSLLREAESEFEAMGVAWRVDETRCMAGRARRR